MARSGGVDQKDREQCGRDGYERLLRAGAEADADARERGPQGGEAEVGARSARTGAAPRRPRLRFRTRWVRDGLCGRGKGPSASMPACLCVDTDRGRVGMVFVGTQWMGERGWLFGKVWSEKGRMSVWERLVEAFHTRRFRTSPRGRSRVWRGGRVGRVE